MDKERKKQTERQTDMNRKEIARQEGKAVTEGCH